MPMRHAKSLLALSLAAAFGGFAATAMRDALQAPAQAAAAATPAVAALPAAVGGQPLPSLAPMLARVTPAVVSVHTKQRVRVSIRSATTRCSGACFPNSPRNGSTSRWARA